MLRCRGHDCTSHLAPTGEEDMVEAFFQQRLRLRNAAFDAPEGQVNFPHQGVHITGTRTIRLDLKLAGFVVHDADATVYDEGANLLTARDPNDLGPLCERFSTLLRQRLAARTSA